MTDNKKTIIDEIIDNYAEHEFPEHIKEKVTEWLNDPGHSGLKNNAMWKVWNRLDPAAGEETEKALCKIKAELGFAEQKRKKNVLNKKSTTWKVAAIITPIAIITAASMLMLFKGTEKYEKEGYAMQTISPGETGKPTQAILSDGSEVWVNNGSVVRTSGGRKAEVSGEAYFKVRKDKSKPFIVSTAFATVTVLGTRFEVKAHNGDSLTVITLFEGSINVTTPTSTRLMSAGEVLTLNNITHEVGIDATLSSEPEWIGEEYTEDLYNILFKELTLSEILDSLRSIYNINMEYCPAQLPNDTITLKLTGNESIEDILFLLSNISGKIKYTTEGNIIRIRQINPR